jgi:imidazolonepropionase-like amidohydrolase
MRLLERTLSVVSKGRIAPGYDADLLAVAGDPLINPAALREVVAVFRAGQRVR